MQELSAFLVPGGLAVFVAAVGIIAVVRDRRRAAIARRRRSDKLPAFN
jgi:hypothetical protein